MAKAWRIQTTVLPGNRVQVDTPGIGVGQPVEVIVLAEAGVPEHPRSTVAEILASLPDGPRLFKSAAEVDAYLDAERSSWDE